MLANGTARWIGDAPSEVLRPPEQAQHAPAGPAFGMVNDVETRLAQWLLSGVGRID
jgi:hypothetical protein